MAMSDTYPATLAKSRGKTLYRYNIKEVQIADDMTGKERTAYEYDEVWIEGKVIKAKVLAAMRDAEEEEIGEVAAQYKKAKDAIALSHMSGLTYKQLDTYIDKNITSLVSAKTFIKQLAKVVLAILKQL